MPEPRIKFVVESKDSAGLEAIKAALELELSGKHVTEVLADWEKGVDVAVFDAKLGDEAEAFSFVDWFKANKAEFALLVNDGYISFHRCSHNDSLVVSCKDDPSSEYTEEKL